MIIDTTTRLANADDCLRAAKDLLTQLRGWRNLQEIPPLLNNRYPFTELMYRCRQTNRAIRFAVCAKPKNPEQLPEEINYEHRVINELLASGTVPHAWPPEVDFIADNVIVSTTVQSMINRALKQIAENNDAFCRQCGILPPSDSKPPPEPH